MIEYTNFNCPVCKRDFRVETKRVRYQRKVNADKIFCCSQSCSNTNKKHYVGKQCENCNIYFTRNKTGVNDKGRFCSRQCSAKFISRSRIKFGLCKYCDKEVPVNKRVICEDCSKNKRVNDMTLGALRERYSISQYHAKIRGNARQVYKRSGRPHSCIECGYALHVDICHIKDLKSFSWEARLSEVNAVQNLVALCKNHHWEFDNGHLSLVL